MERQWYLCWAILPNIIAVEIPKLFYHSKMFARINFRFLAARPKMSNVWKFWLILIWQNIIAHKPGPSISWVQFWQSTTTAANLVLLLLITFLRGVVCVTVTVQNRFQGHEGGETGQKHYSIPWKLHFMTTAAFSQVWALGNFLMAKTNQTYTGKTYTLDRRL